MNIPTQTSGVGTPLSVSPTWRAFATANVRQYAMFVALAIIWLILTFATEGVFISLRNLSNLLLQTASVAILAMGMVLIIVSRNIDLSVGSLVGAIGAVIGTLQVQHATGAVASSLVGLALGVLVGCWHGYWVAYRRVPAIIVTLASMLGLRGLAIAVTHGNTQSPLDVGFLHIGQSYLPHLGFFKNDSTVAAMLAIIACYIALELRRRRSRLLHRHVVAPWSLQIAKMVAVAGLISAGFMIWIGYRGMPYAMLVVLAVGAALQFAAKKTVFGRHIYAIGGNKQASAFSGVNVKSRLFILFVSMGVVAAIGAMVFTSRVGGASADAGMMMELDAIAAAIIGGTSLAGGVGTIPGAFIGALIMSSLDNGMSLMNLDASYQLMVKGGILLLAVWFDITQRGDKE